MPQRKFHYLIFHHDDHLISRFSDSKDNNVAFLHVVCKHSFNLPSVSLHLIVSSDNGAQRS